MGRTLLDREGVGEFYSTDYSAHNHVLQIDLLRKYKDFNKSWSIIVPGHFSDGKYTDLLFYDPTSGLGEFYSTDGKGNIKLLKKSTSFNKSWSIIVPGHLSDGKYTDLLFYEPIVRKK